MAFAPTPASAATTTVGNVTAFSQSGATYSVSAGSTAVQVSFLRADIFRIQLDPSGSFTNPAGSKIAVNTAFTPPATTWSDAGSYYRIDTGSVTLRVYKAPLTFAAYRPDNSTLIWAESAGISWTDTDTTQSLGRGPSEQFYGTGLRLGAWALRGMTVPIAADNGWAENNNASPAPFYMSTNGYGVLRNTWQKGSYAFNSPVTTTQNEKRFDAYYFIGNDLKGVLGSYTDVTGKPFLAPEWGLELGNADCWNASNPTYSGDHTRLGHQTTTDVIAYAQAARNANMPSGWFLPNDGYGCGYTNLQTTVSSLASLGFHTGLWTSTGLPSIATEVGTDGTRGVKTDVGWVGGGYEYAFDGVQQAVNGIENNSNARRFVWTVDGWAGTQRNAIVWTGDNSGTNDTIRWSVPAVASAGLSGLNYASGDVGGIGGGDPNQFTRDLEWKSFLPVSMTMSGWGSTNPSAGYNDKEPWQYSEPNLSDNRKYLDLKMRLMPYHYTMSHTASVTGVPATRALVLEYPNDPVAQGNSVSEEFMAGDNFLVAPVVDGTTTRDGIYLPAGVWTDYWTGKTYQGPTTVNGYNAPLDTLPLFVRQGAIVPMWPQMNYTGEKPVSTLTYDVYPRGNSSFSLYEDDGITRDYQKGSSATQAVNVTAPASGSGNVVISVGASTGSYTGKPASRGYEFTTHLSGGPSAVTVGSTALAALTSKAAYDAATTGYYFDPNDHGGLLWVKAGNQSGAFTTTLTNATVPTPPSTVPSPLISKAGWTVKSYDSQETNAENGAAVNAIDGNTGTFWHTDWSVSPVPGLPHEIQIDMGTQSYVDSVKYLPRQDGGINGRIGDYEVYLSLDGVTWGSPVAVGHFADDATEKTVALASTKARFLRLRALSEAGNRGPWTSAAEISATGVAVPPSPAVQPPANVELVGQAASKCIDLPYGSTTPGTQPTLYVCTKNTNQLWTFTGSGTLTGKDGVCLDASAPIIAVQTCGTGIAGQKFTAHADGTVTNGPGGSSCLTPVGNGTDNGVQLQLAICVGSPSQRWNFVSP
ncbi:hypothetical protein GCM10009838_79330 [Catenulispora subtropica]|uniref:F5/8 type C domain-containing protein n=1 Tax=Catenulispora subtropica TaxID=450798 RepID=A0ABN2TAM2_9ACTN